eukprot:gene6226-8579_t
MDFNRKVDQSKYDATDMPVYPAKTLAQHCAMKGAQLGSIAGLVLFTTPYKFIRRVPFPLAWTTVVPISTFIGCAASLGMLYAKNLDEDGVDDRAYRISKNDGQVLVDKCSMIGAVCGTVVGTVVGEFKFSKLLASASTGLALGVGFYIIEKIDLYNKAKQLFDGKAQSSK